MVGLDWTLQAYYSLIFYSPGFSLPTPGGGSGWFEGSQQGHSENLGIVGSSYEDWKKKLFEARNTWTIT